MTGVPTLRVAGCDVLEPAAPDGVLRDMDILVAGDRISAVAHAGTVAQVAGELTVPGSGRLAVPGLTNAHTHSPESLLRGVSEGAELEEWLIDAFVGRELTSREVELATLLGAAEMLRSGVTTVLDHVGLGPSVDRGVLEAVVSAYSLSGLRVGLAPMLEDRDLLYDRVAAADRDLAADLPHPLGTTQAAADLLAAAFARWDGAGEGRIRVLAGPSSLMWASDRLLERCAQLAGESGRPLHLHAAETWRQERIVRERFGESSIAALDRRGLLGPKTSLAHCIWVGDRDIELLADRGVVVVTNPVSNLRLGSGVAPVARLLAAGVTVAVGTDGAASNDSQNLPEALKLTALLAHRDGIRPAAGITRDALLAMGTTAGARAAGWDDGVGRLVAGAHADLALLDLDAPAFVVLHDALRQWLFAGGAHSARTVIVAGRVVLEDGEPTTIDVPAIAAELRERVSFDPEGAAVRRRAGRAALRQFIDSVGWTRPPRGA